MAVFIVEFKSTSGATCYSYICQPKQVRGKFLIEKAKQMGLDKKYYGPLSQGQTVTLEDGSIINPSQVLDKPEKS